MAAAKLIQSKALSSIIKEKVLFAQEYSLLQEVRLFQTVLFHP
jgi:hypothetical protein